MRNDPHASPLWVVIILQTNNSAHQTPNASYHAEVVWLKGILTRSEEKVVARAVWSARGAFRKVPDLTECSMHDIDSELRVSAEGVRADQHVRWSLIKTVICGYVGFDPTGQFQTRLTKLSAAN